MNLESCDRIRLVGDDGQVRITIDANTAEVEINPALTVSEAAMELWNHLRAVGADDVLARVESADSFDRIKLALDLDPLHTIDDVVEEIERLRTGEVARAKRLEDLAPMRKTDGISRSVLIERINLLCDALVAIVHDDGAERSAREEDVIAERDAMLKNLTETQRRCSQLLLGNRALIWFEEGQPDRLVLVLGDVAAERRKQDEKWGPIDGYLDRPDGSGGVWAREEARRLKEIVDSHRDGTLTWSAILLEEVLEVLAESKPSELRAELVQVAAVASKWIEAMDTREAEARIASVTGPGAIAILPREPAVGGAAAPLNGAPPTTARGGK